MTTKSTYLQIIQTAYALEKGRTAEEYARGLAQIKNSTPLFGYFPPRGLLDFAATCAFLFARQPDEQLAQQAKDALWFYRDWRTHLPADAAQQRAEYAIGIPPLEPVFQPSVFALTLQTLRPALSGAELETLAGLLADTLRPIWRFPEWGGHNRAMLRAAGLALAAEALPDHAEAGQWAALADELAEESWGRWSIEDAMLYQPHWLRALFLYGRARRREAELRDLIQPRLHLKAITQLISPLGILPDFGDSHWLMHSHWEWLACLEWGAAAYNDPAMKWAAQRIYAARQAETPSGYLATVAALAWMWCDEGVAAHPPLNADDALDDLVLKKIVWRTGWDSQAAYACLNYRDEGDYGRVARDYLRTTLAVTAEKMHHGHSDEGSFTMLMHDRTLLLHESGYREQPPDGIYRSTMYHNRLAWRPGAKPENAGLLEFLRGDGQYRPVRSERLYQTRLGDAAIHRLRVTDEVEGLAWDRSIFFLSDLPCWVVIDHARALRSAVRTISSLWWTTDLLAQGEGWYETHLRGVQDWANEQTAALLIVTPPVAGQSGVNAVQPFRRHFQQELALSNTWYGELRSGRGVNFVTVLWPHAYADLDPARAQAVQVIASEPEGRGIGVWLRWQGEERLLGTLNDLSIGFGQEDIRPTYTAQRGMAHYGPLSSDAAFVMLRRRASGQWAGLINGTFLALDGQVGYQGQPHDMFQENRTALPGVPARFRWEGVIPIPTQP